MRWSWFALMPFLLEDRSATACNQTCSLTWLDSRNTVPYLDAELLPAGVALIDADPGAFAFHLGTALQRSAMRTRAPITPEPAPPNRRRLLFRRGSAWLTKWRSSVRTHKFKGLNRLEIKPDQKSKQLSIHLTFRPSPNLSGGHVELLLSDDEAMMLLGALWKTQTRLGWRIPFRPSGNPSLRVVTP